MGFDFKAMEMKRLLPVGLAAARARVCCQPLTTTRQTLQLWGKGAYRQEVIDGQLMNDNSLSCGNIIACNALFIQLINFLSE